MLLTSCRQDGSCRCNPGRERCCGSVDLTTEEDRPRCSCRRCLTGASGSAGATGATGASLSGATGATGASLPGGTGATGVMGLPGLPGVSVFGATGASGGVGSTGATGVSGASGLTGATGTDGGIGATGATGTAFVPPLIPDDLLLYVSAIGNDLTGDGSPGNPYLTIQRALQDVQEFGWNDTAEIRILSTGGPFSWPLNLNVNSGGRGNQATPLVLRGYNFNAVPGRTTVFTQNVVSVTADPSSRLLDIVGAGPYTSAQIGQRMVFLTGPLAAYPVLGGLLGTVQVDVPIVAVPNATTLRIAWRAPSPSEFPNPGDSFSVEALDTILTVNGSSTVRSSSGYLLFEDLILSSSVPVAGMFIEAGGTFQARALNIAATGLFLFLGFDDVVIYGGLNFSVANFGVSGLVPTTKSLFVDIRGGGSFFTAAEGGTQNADFQLSNAGFVGDQTSTGVLSVAGEITATYFDLVEVSCGTVDTRISFSWINQESLVVTQGSYADARNVHIVGGGMQVVQNSECRFGAVLIEEGGVSATEGSIVTGQGLTFAGPAFSQRIFVIDHSVLSISSDLIVGPSTAVAVRVELNSQMIVTGSLTSSGHPGATGVELMTGSELMVTGDATFDSNSLGGLNVTGGSLFQCGGVFSAQNNTGFGVLLTDSRLLTLSLSTVDENGSFGFSSTSSSSWWQGRTLIRMNGTTNVDLQGASTMFVGGDLDVLSIGPTLGGFVSLLADGSSELVVLGLLRAADAQTEAILLDTKSLLTASTLEITNAGSATAAMIMAGQCICQVSGVFSSTGNSGAGLSVQSGSQFYAGEDVSLEDNGGAGLLVSTGSSFSAGGDGFFQGNGDSGMTVTDGRASFFGTLVIQNNATAGASFIRSSLDVQRTLLFATQPGNNLDMSSSSGSIGEDLTISVGAAIGVLLDKSQLVVGDDLTISATTLEGVQLIHGSRLSCNSVTVTASSSAAGIFLTGASLMTVFEDLTSSNNSLDHGISMSGAQLNVRGTTTCEGNGIHGISMMQASTAWLNRATCNTNSQDGINMRSSSVLSTENQIDDGNNGGNGMTLETGSSLTAMSLQQTAGPNLGSYGAELHTSSRLQLQLAGSTMTGSVGNVLVGVNAVTTWANIDSRNPAFTTDYLAAQNPTELCLATL